MSIKRAILVFGLIATLPFLVLCGMVLFAACVVDAYDSFLYPFHEGMWRELVLLIGCIVVCVSWMTTLIYLLGKQLQKRKMNLTKGLISIVVLFLVGCATDESVDSDTSKIIWTYPGIYEVESITNIQAYFDSLYHKCGADIWTHNPEVGESIEVWNAVRELHRFVNHQRKYYPVDEVNKAIGNMAFEQGYCFSHSGDDPDIVNSGESFLFRFIEQAAIHSPKLDFITSFHAEDNQAGILYFPEWCSINPLYSFLVYNTKQGYKVLTIGSKGDVKINMIFHLLDKRGRIYYLCSNNDDSIYFRQYLYGWDGEQMTLLCEAYNVSWDRYGDGYKIVFNPQTLEWKYCLPKNGIYQIVEGTNTYQLILDWEDSKVVKTSI